MWLIYTLLRCIKITTNGCFAVNNIFLFLETMQQQQQQNDENDFVMHFVLCIHLPCNFSHIIRIQFVLFRFISFLLFNFFSRLFFCQMNKTFTIKMTTTAFFSREITRRIEMGKKIWSKRPTLRQKKNLHKCRSNNFNGLEPFFRSCRNVKTFYMRHWKLCTFLLLAVVLLLFLSLLLASSIAQSACFYIFYVELCCWECWDAATFNERDEKVRERGMRVHQIWMENLQKLKPKMTV